MQGKIGLLLVVCVVAGWAAAATADDTVALFDGKSLQGWSYFSRASDAKMSDTWSAGDGVIRCTGNPPGYLRTKQKFASYRLALEWRFPGPRAGNSGVLLRMVGEDKVWPKSVEAQLMHNNAGDIWCIDRFPIQGDPGRTRGRRTRKMAESSEKPKGEWNQYEIRLDGGDLTLTVNGTLQNKATNVEEVAGYIGLQSEGVPIEFRNIVLTPLD